MQGTIIQTIGLVLAANARKRGIALKHFWPDSTIFQFCRHVRFIDGKPSGFIRKRHKVICDDPALWLERNAGFFGARVRVIARDDPNISDMHSVGFVGGGRRWIIELVGEELSELWEDRWEVVDQHAPDHRIWGVEYLRSSDSWQGEPELERSLTEIRGELDETLADISRFSEQHDLSHYHESFERAYKQLNSTEPMHSVYHADLVPAGTLMPDAERLLAAAQAAWVFGGMGSWNDIWFEGDGGTYTEVSERLFSLLNEAAAAATNSSFPDNPAQGA